MRRFIHRAATVALAAAGVVVMYGCTEKLEGGRACPILCPDQNVELRDTLIAGVVLDTTLESFPPIGEELLLALINRADTLETRVIIRFDTLPTTYQAGSPPTATPIDFVENALLQVRLEWPVLGGDRTVTIEAYDVDTTLADGGAADTAAATMLPLFRPDRFLGSLNFDSTAIRADSTARIPINDAYVLAKIQSRARLRVGLLVRGAASANLVLQGVAAGRPDSLTFRVSTDDAVPRARTGPYSATPTERFIANALSDFVIVARRRPPDTPPEVLTVGGIPGRRTYLRFDLPPGIIDSTAIVRATLLLTQYPNRLAAYGADSVYVEPRPVVASELVTDLHTAAGLLGAVSPFRLDSLRIAPDDSGGVEVEVVGLVQTWRQTEPEQASRALVLRVPVGSEGVAQDEVFFYSTEAPAALRPRLRIVYVPRVGFGLP